MKIIFEFDGGPKDGQRYIGDTDHGSSYSVGEVEAGEAAGFYFLSDNGRIGARFQGLSEHTSSLIHSAGHDRLREMGVRPQLHTYEVFERMEESGEVLIRAKYIPLDAGQPADNSDR